MLLFRPAVLALLASASLLTAQTADHGLAVDIKLRTGMDLSPNANPDNLARNFLGFGAGLSYPVGPGRVNAELGYFYKAGSQYRQAFEAPAPGMNAVVSGYVYSPQGAMLGMPISSDVRQNKLSGLTARVAYELPLMDHLALQTGLQVGGTAYRHTYVGTATSQYITPYGSLSPKTSKDYRDHYWGTETSSGTDISPFLGVTWQVNRESSLELNVVALRYRSLTFRHTPGSAVVSGSIDIAGSQVRYEGDEVLKTSRTRPQLELTYRFRL